MSQVLQILLCLISFAVSVRESCPIRLLVSRLFSALIKPRSLHRYQYYLQLKKDVLDGRISCSLEQAIRLASLAVQGNVNF